jgi:hypothetical protein
VHLVMCTICIYLTFVLQLRHQADQDSHTLAEMNVRRMISHSLKMPDFKGANMGITLVEELPLGADEVCHGYTH